jgi:hypothetical protein
MGAGLHGINGINPLIAWKLWRTFVVPRMLYEIETLKITTTDMGKNLLSVPESVTSAIKNKMANIN